MRSKGTIVRDRSGDSFSVPVMSLPVSPEADGGPVRVRQISDEVVELVDGIGRTRMITQRDGKVMRMETSLHGTRGSYERVDQRKDGARFVSAFVQPGLM